jgi:hypothetical protein
MINGPYYATQYRLRARWQEFVLIKMISSYRKPQVITFACVIKRLYTQMGSCHEPAGGAPAAGIGGGVSAERIPRGTPPNLARRGGTGGEIATKTQELRPISNCDTLPNHVLRLAHFGASPTCAAAGWCGPIAIMLTRGVGAPITQQYDPKVQHASDGGC